MKKTRSAFTLIEILVVISMITVLAVVLVVAAIKVLGKVPEVETRVEIGQLDAAIAAFMSDYDLKDPPPSFIYLREDGLYNKNIDIELATITWFQKWLGRPFSINSPQDWNGNGVIDHPYFLQGQQCLVLWTGGIPVYTNGSISMKGFGSSKSNPADVIGIQRHGPYFNFESTRLEMQGHFPIYKDPWLVRGAPKPYAYFSAQGIYGGYNLHTMSTGGDCSIIGANVYQNGPALHTNVTVYHNPTKYQILSAGKDGMFGYDLTPNPVGSVFWNPRGGSFGPTSARLSPSSQPYGWDDQTNLSSTLMGVGQH